MRRLRVRVPRRTARELAEHIGVGLVCAAAGYWLHPGAGVGLWGGWMVLWANRTSSS